MTTTLSTRRTRRTRLAGLIVAGVAGLGVLLAPGGGDAHASTTVPECHPADVHLRFRATDNAAGHRYGKIVLRNVSDHICRTGGFGGVSYQADNLYGPVGAAADREGGYRRFNLRPGQRATSVLEETNWQMYSRSECTPHRVDHLKIYIPNARRTKLVAHSTHGCLNSDIHLMLQRAYRKVR